ncbi:hypothetical protein ACFVYR_13940 [Streptomyces sp. NPDC058284]|uniref:hypothetical protein n=1 Tax=unclassified Streptomyces TaxID=2593676 RepID=UPI00366629DB
MTEWNAYFTAGVPHEAVADLLIAIDAHEAPDVGFEGPERVLTALGAQGWLRDVDRPRTTATDPGFSCTVSLELLPPLVQDADPRPDLVGWQAWAEPVLGAPYQLRPDNNEGSDRSAVGPFVCPGGRVRRIRDSNS